MYNINKGNNAELLSKCGFLKDYMIFIDYVRQYYDDENMNLADAIEHAISRCIDEDVLKDFLISRREEVAKVTNLDFTFERQIELEREEAMLYGAEQEIFKSVQEGDYGIEGAAEKLGITEAEFVEKMEAAGYKIPTLV